jgi:hypothetical protein
MKVYFLMALAGLLACAYAVNAGKATTPTKPRKKSAKASDHPLREARTVTAKKAPCEAHLGQIRFNQIESFIGDI